MYTNYGISMNLYFGVQDQHVCLTFCLLQFLKFVNFREYYSLEFSMWFLFAFGPYFLAEGLHLSGIMAVLFCGIVMSHYTHYNLTPVTQVTVQQTMRTVSFLAGTCMYVCTWVVFVLACLYVRKEVFMVLVMILLTFCV